MVALPWVQIVFSETQQVACMFAQNLHGTVSPAVTLFFVIGECVGYQTLAVAVVNVNRLMPVLKNPKTQLGVFGNCVHAPTPHILQHRAPNHGHGAVLNNGIAFISGHHAQVKKALVFRITQRLERILLRVPVILRGLHNRNFSLFKLGGQVFQPIGQHFVIGINHRNHFDFVAGLVQCIIQGTGFVPCQRFYMKKTKALAQHCAVRLHRLPGAFMGSVVVNNQHFKVRVIKPGQSIQCVDQHVGRLFISRNMNRHERQIPAAARCVFHNRQQTLSALVPHGFGPFMGFRQHDHKNPCNAQQQKHRNGHRSPGVVLLREIVNYVNNKRRHHERIEH